VGGTVEGEKNEDEGGGRFDEVKNERGDRV